MNGGINPDYFKAFFFVDEPAGGWPRRFGIVTAFNPCGHLRSLAENAAADAELQAALEGEGFSFFRASGGKKDGSYLEHGFGIEAESFKELRPFCRRFLQDAFFWIDGGRVFVIGTESDETNFVGSWSERLIGGMRS